jgi:DNA-binding response OmpR family regulator/REP element-mobilizing transposase RayT
MVKFFSVFSAGFEKVKICNESVLPLWQGRDTLLMMTTPLLIVTSDVPFGDLIRQSLEETGRFVVHLAGEKQTAVTCVRELDTPLAFLDTCLPEKDVLETGRLLRKSSPEIRLVIISETGWHSALEELAPDDYLSKPFYLPDLLDMMDKFFRLSKTVDTVPVQSPLDKKDEFAWLSDVTRAAQHLTRLTLESSAQAALITRNDQLWAYAGQLPQSATRELADTVARYWDREEENDLVRFVRLASTDAEHMLYATRLAQGMVLALVFDAETPFSTIRTQANQLVHSLSNSPSDEQPHKDSYIGEESMTSLSDILNDVPPPNPPENSAPVLPNYTRDASLLPPKLPVNNPHFSRESSPAMPVRPLVPTEQEEVSADLEKTLEVPVSTRKSKARKKEPAPERIEDTRPRSITEVARKMVLEPVSPSVYNLNYACLLIPRFTHHYLAGDLGERLSEWVPQICVAFGWRLEYISVRPDYLQWVVNVPPATSPGYLMRILRQHTSEKIFFEFPRFKKENPSGDFWAPGYLIMGGSQPPPAQLIKDFTVQTRQRQGISQSLKP